MEVKGKILLIEDDEELAQLIASYFKQYCYIVDCLSTAREATEAVLTRSFDLVILDLTLPDGDGLSILETVKKRQSTPVIVVSSKVEVQTIVKALKMGADDYIQKPVDFEKLRTKISDLIRFNSSQDAETSTSLSSPFSGSKVMDYIWKQIASVIDSDIPIIIYGETGTGKTNLAKQIHNHSQRNSSPFVHINCPSIPETLMESEIFGHTKGAFTGADKESIGKLEFANGGSVFLDEIGDISLSFQAKLLRTLESHEFERLGSNKTIKANVRFLAATNKNLEQEIQNSNFREDLYYRLNVFPVYIPPLRERKADIVSLVNLCLHKIAQQFKKTIPNISSESLQKLSEHNWPGNIRELENVIQRAFYICQNNLIESADIQLNTAQQKENKPKINSIKEIEYQKLMDAIEESGGNITKMANLLGIGRDTVYRRLAKYGINYK